MTFSLSTILHNMYIHFVKLCFTYFLVIAGSRYCSGYSRNLYKTFDGALYAFDGECTYLLYSDEVITVTISLSQCENTATCVKVRMLQLRDCMCWVSIFAPSICYTSIPDNIAMIVSACLSIPCPILKFLHWHFIESSYIDSKYAFLWYSRPEVWPKCKMAAILIMNF